MLNQKGFDQWASQYDQNVEQTDESQKYPFAGYNEILAEIEKRVLSRPHEKVLDIGFGTGVLTSRLYRQGCGIYGQDFSEKMIDLARQKMPDARLYQGDFTQRLVRQLQKERYDAILSTYALHHLTDGQKVQFLKELLPLLQDGGCIYIGDVAFETRAALKICRAQEGQRWDPDEIYFVVEELKEAFPKLQFEKFSYCAGLLSLQK